MKTAVRQLMERIENASRSGYEIEEVLEMLTECEIIQDTQIKIAYLHGGMAVLEKSEVKSDEYFDKQFN